LARGAHVALPALARRRLARHGRLALARSGAGADRLRVAPRADRRERLSASPAERAAPPHLTRRRESGKIAAGEGNPMLSRLLLVALPLLLLPVAGLAPGLAQDAPASATHTDADFDALLARMTTAEKVGQLVQRMGGRQRALNSRLGPEELERV